MFVEEVFFYYNFLLNKTFSSCNFFDNNNLKGLNLLKHKIKVDENCQEKVTRVEQIQLF